MRSMLTAPGRGGMPARVVLEADVGAVVPDGHEDTALVRRALDLRKPVTISGAPGVAILGQPIAQGSPGLPPDRVHAFSPETGCCTGFKRFVRA